MSYITIKKLNGSDVENILEFCETISSKNKPYHVEFLEILLEEIFFYKSVKRSKLIDLIMFSYGKAIQKHVKIGSIGPPPNAIQYFGRKCLRYRPVRSGRIITLDLDSKPAILLIQTHKKNNVIRLAKKMNTEAIFHLEDPKVLFPSEALTLQIPLGNIEFVNHESLQCVSSLLP